MGNVAFPEYVDTFIEATNRYLGFFDAKLGELTDNPKIDARSYQISTGDGPVEFIVHRTSRSFEQPVGEYRARVVAALKPEFAEFLRGKGEYLNRFATLGALVTTNKDASVICQCLIQPDFQDTTPGVLAAALIHARPSILDAVRRAFSQEPPPAVEKLSAWSDLDFEQLHYDYAHLGIGSLGSRRWVMQLHPYGLLSLDAVHNNPYWGGGLL
jgi:hypothetical protein